MRLRGKLFAGQFVCIFSFLTLSACKSSNAPGDQRAAEDAIRKSDADWVKAAQSKQVDAWLAFYTDDAAVLPPNDKLATGKESIRKPVAEMLGMPGSALTWQPSKVEVAQSGDLGYLYGTYQMSWDDSGKRATDTGKIVEIWKKQTDGNWKCIVDTWNSDLPAAAASPSK